MHPVDGPVFAGMEFLFVTARMRIRVLLQEIQGVFDDPLTL
jgi:hypothetical protein